MDGSTEMEPGWPSQGIDSIRNKRLVDIFGDNGNEIGNDLGCLQLD